MLQFFATAFLSLQLDNSTRTSTKQFTTMQYNLYSFYFSEVDSSLCIERTNVSGSETKGAR